MGLKAEKIILHGLFDSRVVLLLFLQPWLMNKSYWIIWGGDLYKYQSENTDWKWGINEYFRRSVIKKIGYIVTGNAGDYALAKKWYKSCGEQIDCFVYPSNIIDLHYVPTNKNAKLGILIGNSATPSNNHNDIFDKLILHKDKDFQIYCPLSYGDKRYAEKIAERGKELFGEKFIPLFDFIPYGDYLKILEKVDIAIFNHMRQQAFGTKITLLGLGKKIYLSKQSTLWEYFKEKELAVFDIDELDLNILDKKIRESNMRIIKKNYSKEHLIKCLELWLA